MIKETLINSIRRISTIFWPPSRFILQNPPENPGLEEKLNNSSSGSTGPVLKNRSFFKSLTLKGKLVSEVSVFLRKWLGISKKAINQCFPRFIFQNRSGVKTLARASAKRIDQLLPKQWWIYIRGKKEGPLTLKELRNHRGLFPETLVWKMGWPKWVSAIQVHELSDLFREPNPSSKSDEKKRKGSKEVEILVARAWNPNFFWLLLLIVIVLIYTLFRFF